MGNSVMLNGIEYAGEQIAYKDSTYELALYTFPIITERCNVYSLSGNTSRFSQRLI